MRRGLADAQQEPHESLHDFLDHEPWAGWRATESP